MSRISFLILIAFIAGYPGTFSAKGTNDGCIRAGGICMEAQKCPNEIPTEYLGLCSQGGEECCHGISLDITDCAGLLGMCFPLDAGCKPDATSGRATDCPPGTKCCTLI